MANSEETFPSAQSPMVLNDRVTSPWYRFFVALWNRTDGAAPTGLICRWPNTAVPTGWLLLNGAAVSRSTYSELFALIGTTFGVGDGSTTFNIPTDVSAPFGCWIMKY